MRKIFLRLGVLAISAAAWAQSDARPEILVLGTYHMANPGHDIFNLKADDVLSPKRQEEMAHLIEVLKRFHPTKIAIEADVESQKPGQAYADYVAGKYTLTRDETNQIGYRLAKELGHRAIYPINVDGEFPIQHVATWAKANGRSEKMDAMMATAGTRVKELDDFMHSHTVLETLVYMNDDAMVAKDVGLYYASAPYGEPGDYAGPDLLAMWYQRNIRIYHNIVALIESPNERILVIYGAGHLGWLRQDAANDQTVRLRELAEFERK